MDFGKIWKNRWSRDLELSLNQTGNDEEWRDFHMMRLRRGHFWECCVCTSSSRSCDLWPATRTHTYTRIELFCVGIRTPLVSKNMGPSPGLAHSVAHRVSTAWSKFSRAAERLHGPGRLHWPLKLSLFLSVQLWPESASYHQRSPYHQLTTAVKLQRASRHHCDI